MATPLLQPLAVVCFAAHRGVQVEAVDVGTQSWRPGSTLQHSSGQPARAETVEFLDYRALEHRHVELDLAADAGLDAGQGARRITSR